jgi:hypothetical protein
MAEESSSDCRYSTTEHSFTGAEPFLVGISPQYWSHVPMHISDVLQLQLVHGINCWSVPSKDDDHDDHDSAVQVPVSKCQLVGTIVSASIRSDASTAFVLDDGTGLIDCMLWSNHHDDGYALPSLLLADGPPAATIPTTMLGIGDLVRVFGKIHCLAILSQPDHPTGFGPGSGPVVVREILASLMERIVEPPPWLGGDLSYSLDAEARHWMACANHCHSSSVASKTTTTPPPTNHPTTALDYLKLLGPQITAHVHERRRLPAAGDTIGAWRVFGVSCHCTLDYKERLLYCHCQAKAEPMDPNFTVRDALLRVLIEWQDEDEEEEEWHHHETKPQPQPQLVFGYQQIKSHARLRTLAANQSVASSSGAAAAAGASNTTVHKSNLFVDRLLLNTFRALRQDGILYLMDQNTDRYLFITRDRVLEPYVRNETRTTGTTPTSESSSKNFIHFRGAPFLSKVHQERLLYIQRCLKKKKK